MRRREFNIGVTSLAATGLAAPAVANNSQDNDEEDKPGAVAPHGHVVLRTDNGVVQPIRLIILPTVSDNQVHISLLPQFPQDNENRASFLSPTLGKRFSNATLAGELRLWNRTLIAALQQEEVSRELFLMNQAISWFINSGRLAESDNTRIPVLGNLPYLGPIFRRQVASVEKQQLLILVTPTIIDDDMN